MSLLIVLRRTAFVPSLSRTNLVHSRPKVSSKRIPSRRNLSSETVPATKPNEVSVEAASNDAATTTSLEGVVRHGPGDGIICLDVGGKHFYTLRSTIASNPVLTDIVARAEANGELTSAGHAVFVDRDPKHFHTILTYLRNESEGLSFTKKTPFKTKHHRVQLPGDKSQLADLYVEATYFQIEPLKDALCHHSLFTLAASAVSGGSNPFSTVADGMKSLRRVAFGLAGVGSISIPSLVKNKDDNKEQAETNESPPPKDPEPSPSSA